MFNSGGIDWTIIVKSLPTSTVGGDWRCIGDHDEESGTWQATGNVGVGEGEEQESSEA